MNNEKSIDILNELIEINNDRIEGYKTASKETEEQELKRLFSTLIETSENCRLELRKEVGRLGGTPIEGTKATGKIYRAWMDAKAALTGNDRKAILDSCEYGEDIAVEAYDDAMENEEEDLGAEQRSLIERQRAQIKDDHDLIKTLRDSVVEKD